MNHWRWLVGAALVATVAATTWTPPASVAVVVGPDGVDAAPGPRVAMPWQPGRPQLGIHVYWEDNPVDDNAAIRRKAVHLLEQIVGLEANAVALSFPFFTDSISASAVRVDARTPSPARVAIVLDEARRAGLRTTLRPLLDQTTLWDAESISWRGTLRPADRSRWYASYLELIRPYLQLAQLDRVDTMIVGAELTALQGDPQWAALAQQARALYTGELGYSANWDAYPTAATGIPVDVIGIDAYPGLALQPWSTEPEMAAAWDGWLQRTAGPGLAGLVLSEVGGPAEAGLVYNPAALEGPDAVLDEDIQRRWFAAACHAARTRGIAGLYWWKLDFHVDVARADPDADPHDSFLGRPSEQAIRDCFVAWRAA